MTAASNLEVSETSQSNQRLTTPPEQPPELARGLDPAPPGVPRSTAVAGETAMAHKRAARTTTAILVAIACLASAPPSAAFILRSIQIDGQTSDWEGVLLSAANGV